MNTQFEATNGHGNGVESIHDQAESRTAQSPSGTSCVGPSPVAPDNWLTEQIERGYAAFQEGLAEIFQTSCEGLSERHLRDVSLGIKSFMEKELPAIIKSMTLISSLGVLREGDWRYFRRRGLSVQDADDLAQMTAEKVMKPLFAGMPRANVGAWRAAIREHVLIDFYRRRTAEETHRPCPLDEDQIPDCRNRMDLAEMVEEVLARCSPIERRMIEERWHGESWQEIGYSHAMTPAMVRDAVERGFSLSATVFPLFRPRRK